MKKQFGKKIWSVLLALVMLLSLLPVSAFADDTTAAVETTIDEQSLAGNNITGGASTPGEAPATDDETQAESDGSAANTNGGINEENAADAEINGENADGWDVSEPVSSYTVSITLPEEGVALADGQSEELLNQTVSAGGEVADIRLVSTYEDEPFESDMADLFNARLFKDTGLTASFGEDGIITIGGTPTADVTVNLADAFADEPATVADNTAVYVATATATDSYTTPLGNDSTGNGTVDKPYATISKAYSAVTTGGTIYLLSDVDVSSQIIFNSKKTVTITSSGDRKTIRSKVSATRYEFNSNISGADTTFTNVVLDGSGQTTYPGAITMSAGTVTLGENALIQNYNFPNTTDHSNSISGVSVIYLQNGGARLNISGATITNCKIERGYWDNPSAIITVGTGATVFMTSGTITGNSLQTYLDTASGKERLTAIINVGRYCNPHFWMTGGTITGNDIG